ncbi:MAG TPA: ASCH domain-containing protein [Burkholderiales bacterium]|nr:ASCH domain-containing protein [Burkholderiales bacterium]
MNIPSTVRAFWEGFEAAAGRDVTPRFYEAFHFDDNEPSANELAKLVLSGTKRATTALLWSFEAESKPLPKPGDLSVVTNWQGQALCVIETRSVETVPFEMVTEEFAATEGEGNGSLQYWREAHWSFFGRECRRINREPTQEMPVLCERFEVVYRPGL